jgi:dodecin
LFVGTQLRVEVRGEPAQASEARRSIPRRAMRAAASGERNEQENPEMSEHVYKQIELTGSSPVSSDDAVRNAIAKASKTIRGMRWFEVTDTRGHIDDNALAHWQVTIKVGFTLEE